MYLVDKGTFGCRNHKLECLPTYRGILSRPPLVYLIEDQKTEGKCCIKTWTAILAEIFQPGSLQVKLLQESSRENEGGISGERDRQRDTGDLVSSNSPGHDLRAKHGSLFLEDI